MVLRTLRGCSPFIACGLISTFTQWKIGTLVALVLSLVLLAVALRGDGVGGAVLEISSVVFCGATVALAYATPHLVIREFVGAISAGWLALTAWATIAVHRPFTLAPERRLVAGEIGRHPAFHRTHVVVTAVWAAGFTATAVVLAVVEHVAPHSGFTEVVIQLAGNLVPAVFAYRYAAGRHHEVPGSRPGLAAGA